METPIDKPYKSKRKGRRTWCISSDIPLRIEYIMFVKGLIKQAEDVYERWREGDFSVPFPSGLYPPSMPKQSELLPSAIFEDVKFYN